MTALGFESFRELPSARPGMCRRGAFASGSRAEPLHFHSRLVLGVEVMTRRLRYTAGGEIPWQGNYGEYLSV